MFEDYETLHSCRFDVNFILLSLSWNNECIDLSRCYGVSEKNRGDKINKKISVQTIHVQTTQKP